jgi:hypothetical protein
MRRDGEETGAALATVAMVLGIVVSLTGLWDFGVRNDFIPGPSPTEGVKDGVKNIAEGRLPWVDPEDEHPPTEDELAAPTVEVIGDCAGGLSLGWGPVDGADEYGILRDGEIVAGVTETMHVIEDSDGEQHEYNVIASAADERQSEPSEGVFPEPCPAI